MVKDYEIKGNLIPSLPSVMDGSTKLNHLKTTLESNFVTVAQYSTTLKTIQSLENSKGIWLDKIGEDFNLTRLQSESDTAYRMRIKAVSGSFGKLGTLQYIYDTCAKYVTDFAIIEDLVKPATFNVDIISAISDEDKIRLIAEVFDGKPAGVGFSFTVLDLLPPIIDTVNGYVVQNNSVVVNYPALSIHSKVDAFPLPHTASDWQESKVADFSTISWESINDTVNLVTVIRPNVSDILWNETRYYRVRYRSGDTLTAWSEAVSLTYEKVFVSKPINAPLVTSTQPIDNEFSIDVTAGISVDIVNQPVTTLLLEILDETKTTVVFSRSYTEPIDVVNIGLMESGLTPSTTYYARQKSLTALWQSEYSDWSLPIVTADYVANTEFSSTVITSNENVNYPYNGSYTATLSSIPVSTVNIKCVFDFSVASDFSSIFHTSGVLDGSVGSVIYQIPSGQLIVPENLTSNTIYARARFYDETSGWGTVWSANLIVNLIPYDEVVLLDITKIVFDGVDHPFVEGSTYDLSTDTTSFTPHWGVFTDNLGGTRDKVERVVLEGEVVKHTNNIPATNAVGNQPFSTEGVDLPPDGSVYQVKMRSGVAGDFYFSQTKYNTFFIQKASMWTEENWSYPWEIDGGYQNEFTYSIPNVFASNSNKLLVSGALVDYTADNNKVFLMDVDLKSVSFLQTTYTSYYTIIGDDLVGLAYEKHGIGTTSIAKKNLVSGVENFTQINLAYGQNYNFKYIGHDTSKLYFLTTDNAYSGKKSMWMFDFNTGGFLPPPPPSSTDNNNQFQDYLQLSNTEFLATNEYLGGYHRSYNQFLSTGGARYDGTQQFGQNDVRLVHASSTNGKLWITNTTNIQVKRGDYSTLADPTETLFSQDYSVFPRGVAGAFSGLVKDGFLYALIGESILKLNLSDNTYTILDTPADYDTQTSSSGCGALFLDKLGIIRIAKVTYQRPVSVWKLNI